MNFRNPIDRFYNWLLPDVRPIDVSPRDYLRWFTLVGGPADGKRFKLRSRIGDSLRIPIYEPASVSPYANYGLPVMRAAVYMRVSWKPVLVWIGSDE